MQARASLRSGKRSAAYGWRYYTNSAQLKSETIHAQAMRLPTNSTLSHISASLRGPSFSSSVLRIVLKLKPANLKRESSAFESEAGGAPCRLWPPRIPKQRQERIRAGRA